MKQIIKVDLTVCKEFCNLFYIFNNHGVSLTCYVWDADNSLLWHGCDEILTIWELRKL